MERKTWREHFVMENVEKAVQSLKKGAISGLVWRWSVNA
jgi:hypothetical protein